jgi:hypothetical protein
MMPSTFLGDESILAVGKVNGKFTGMVRRIGGR